VTRRKARPPARARSCRSAARPGGAHCAGAGAHAAAARVLGRAALLAMACASAPLGQASASAHEADPQPLCRVMVSLDPPRAVVGQQVVYRLHIERRTDVAALRWERNLSFPAFRAEWLPGSVGRGSPEGGSFQVFEERRALFPVRAGTFEIPEAGLLCRSAEGEEIVPIPAAELLVEEPPERGRPEGWQGLVGPVEMFVSVSPDELALGESVRVSVLVHGPANLWDLVPPLDAAALGPEFEIFSLPRSMARDSGRRLTLRRYFNYDLVPRRAGRFELPALRLVYFDPDVGRYGVTEARGPAFTVRPPSPEDGPEDPMAGPPAAPPVGDDGPAPGLAAWALAAAGSLGIAAGGLALLARARRRGRGASADREIAAALEEAEAAERAGEVARAAAALARALRAALASQMPEARALSTEELGGRARGEQARAWVALLARLDRLRFAGEGSPAELAAVRAAFRASRSAARDPGC
jgi:hypothetical protein